MAARRLWFEWFDSLKRYANLRPQEARALIYSILVIGFIITFRKWGISKDIDFFYGFVNLLGGLLIAGITLYGRLMLQKAAALGAEFQAEYKMWSLGLLIALILAFLTNGNLWFLIPGGIYLHFMPGHRLGWVRYGLSYFGVGVVALFGTIGN